METHHALVDFHGSSQVDLERVLPHFTQLRNCYSSSTNILKWANVLRYVLSDVIAQAVNRTIIARGHPEYHADTDTENGKKWPRLFPNLSLFDDKNQTANGIWKSYYNKVNISSKVTPEIIRVGGQPWNFAYCSVPKRQADATFYLHLFTDSYDVWTWLSLALSFIFVSIFSFPVPSFFSSLAVLISPGASGVRKKWGKSKLFIVWMLACQILCTTYTGLMSGHIVSPSSEGTLSDLSALDRHNYSIIGEGSPGWISILSSAPYSLRGKISILQNIYKKFPLRHVSKSQVVSELTGKNKVAIVRRWLFTLGTANDINDLVKAGRVSASDKKKCYVGEELISTEEIHFALTPPGSYPMRQFLQRFISSGIFFRWVEESNWLTASPRVQDRVRIISPTKVLNDKVGQVKPLKMKETALVVFILWGSTCLITCLIGFALELISVHLYKSWLDFKDHTLNSGFGKLPHKYLNQKKQQQRI